MSLLWPKMGSKPPPPSQLSERTFVYIWYCAVRNNFFTFSFCFFFFLQNREPCLPEPVLIWPYRQRRRRRRSCRTENCPEAITSTVGIRAYSRRPYQRTDLTLGGLERNYWLFLVSLRRRDASPKWLASVERVYVLECCRITQAD